MFQKAIRLISRLPLVLVICLTYGALVEAQLPEPVSFWRFEEGSGGTTADVGIGQHPGTLVGNVTFVNDDERGSVLQFGAGRSYVETNAWVAELGTADFSIAAWIQTRDEGAAILGKSNGDRQWDFHEKQFYLSAGTEQGQPVAGGVHFYGNQAGEIWGNTEVNNGIWHHVCVTWDNDTDEQHIYVDGVLDDLRPVWVYYGGRGDNAEDSVRIGFDCSGDAVSDFNGRMDDVAIFDVTLTPEQVIELMYLARPATASNPNPYDGMTDVPRREIILGWTPGAYASTHDVYFGTDFNDVNDAGRTNPPGILASESQPQEFYPANAVLDLDFGTTYYWRIDEVNAAPDYTVHKGETWQFTTELFAYPIAGESINVAASSQAEGQGPENTVNGSGLTDGLHSDTPAAMWLTALGATEPAWIEYEFDKAHKLVEMRVWNQNGRMEPAIGFGCKEVSIEYSVDGIDYVPLGTTHEFARAPGKPDYAYNTAVDFGGVTAKYVRLTIQSNWGDILKQYGLSEVEFFSIPVFAREPRPAPSETEVDVNVTLQWRTGREATAHDVYLGTDEQAVMDDTTPLATVTMPSHPAELDLASTYYWRIDEVNDAEIPSVWKGSIWSFSTQDYIVVDNFETYTNDSPDRVFQTWIDGLGFSPDDFFPAGNNGNGSGSLVGYDPLEGEIMETTIVHGGSKAMPVVYDNIAATYSETRRTFDGPQDWTKHGIKAMTLWFYGDPTNDAQQMYVKINNVKVPYDGSADDLKLDAWQMWYIDLTSHTVNNVSTLSIGLDRLGTVGGQGMVLIDDLLLYSQDRQSIMSGGQ